ncbi:phosphatidylglycerophosphatase A family protein [Roseitranquillus sediminis]|uniref:phosphatidylglycerophosphatase A family protein n=1 Tax=Roseitranquillus sediminis TaxID=2809051 RepID=UPI001D0C0095|nr:phosphatidylglycerophosphatase A [Roseitranquillus sediminis]MBM9595551.1 phosphatidylglycerophosphatase A [Roseitranquillus sediminis]
MSLWISTLFGIGYLRPGPGTWGSAVAVLLAWLLHGLGSFPLLALATLLAFLGGWWAVADATRGASDHDPGEIVVDEVVGQWIGLWPLSAGLWWAGFEGWTFPWPGWVGAFLLFRLFDIWKPGPVGWADRRGDVFGTMMDDVIAGFLAAIVVAAAAYIAHAVVMA